MLGSKWTAAAAVDLHHGKTGMTSLPQVETIDLRELALELQKRIVLR
jgi:hypothetical protein